MIGEYYVAQHLMQLDKLQLLLPPREDQALTGYSCHRVSVTRRDATSEQYREGVIITFSD
jgi:hypothetical protein